MPTHVTRSAGPFRRNALAVAVAVIALAGAASASALNTRGFTMDGTTLLAFDPATPSAVTATPITGINAGDAIVGLAVRPQNGWLYALGFNSGAGTVQIYHLNQYTGVATAVGATGAFVNGVGTPVPVTGPNFGFAVNPATDRLRVVTSSGQTFRINPNTGAFVDGDLGGAAGSVAGLNMDGAVNGAVTSLDAAAFTNRRANTTVTTAYTLSTVTDTLHIQNPPNSGTQTLQVSITQNGIPVNVTAAAGMDFRAGVTVAVSNTAATGVAHAILNVAGTNGLYTIDLTSGAATLLGPVGIGAGVLRGFALQNEEATGAAPAIALGNGGTQLVRFNTATPGTTTSVALTGIVAGETVVGIGWRPATGELFGLGINATADTGTVYRIDPQTGAATIVGTPSQVAFVTGLGAAVDLPAAAYGIDFNPATDRIRVVTQTGLSFRLNPVTGAPIDGDIGGAAGSVPGTNTDGPINGLPGGSTGLTGAAYTNVLKANTGVTTLYTLDPASGALFIQNPPNTGTQTNRVNITLGGVPPSIGAHVGFDIRPGVDATASGAPVPGSADAILTIAGISSLYRIDLATGVATSAGALPAGTYDGLAIGDVPPPSPPPPPPPPTADPPPTLTGFGLSALRFRVGTRPPGTPKVPSGTKLKLTLSEPSTVTFTIQRKTIGRKVSGVCKAKTKANAKKPSCVRFVAAGKITKLLPAGASTVNFSGKIGTKALSVGSYRVFAQAKDSAGQLSSRLAKTFTIIR